ncbi:MAG: hypothetical protein AB7L71_07740 [Vicinamibacterales bacterium]
MLLRTLVATPAGAGTYRRGVLGAGPRAAGIGNKLAIAVRTFR